MRVVPVLDLRRGQVVHGVGGVRDRYQPIHSKLVSGAQPAGVARAMRPFATGGALYVADLDAIQGQAPQYSAWSEILACAPQLWIDAGLRSSAHWEELQSAFFAQGPIDPSRLHWIVGLESVDEPDELAALATRIGHSQTIFSLDMQAGRLLTRRPDDWPADSAHLVDLVIEAGFQHIILLDLAYVGRSAGVPIAALARQCTQQHPHVRWSVGGGVRNLADLVQLSQSGCYAALVATALHSGQLTSAQLDRL